ncbi:hypothetical protein D3C86_1913360 [compost metagenome]
MFVDIDAWGLSDFGEVIVHNGLIFAHADQVFAALAFKEEFPATFCQDLIAQPVFRKCTCRAQQGRFRTRFYLVDQLNAFCIWPIQFVQSFGPRHQDIGIADDREHVPVQVSG